MSTATFPEHHEYATIDTTLEGQPVEHFAIIGSTVWRCEQTDCDGIHHYYRACVRQ